MASTGQARHREAHKAVVGEPDAPLRMPTRTWHALPTIVALLSCATFTLLLALVLARGKAPLEVDEAALAFALSVRSAQLTAVMTDVTAIVMPSVLAIVSVALCALGRSPRLLVAALADAGGAVALNWMVKHLVGRPRPPEELRLALETSTSFPSSHAITALAFYGLLIWLVVHYQRPGAWRTTLVAILAGAIVLVDASRIYLAVHYLTDVVAGTCLGLVWLAAYTRYVAPRIICGGRRTISDASTTAGARAHDASGRLTAHGDAATRSQGPRSR